jgi:O-antigen biosynthesis protein
MEDPGSGFDSIELERLRAELVSAKEEIAQMYSSPGWAIISRYRNWLKSHQLRRSLIWRVYEPAALWALRRTGLSRQSGGSNGSHGTAQAHDSDSYRDWYLRVEPSEEALSIQRKMSAQLSYRPLISVLVPVFRVPLPVVRAMVVSVMNQTYAHWELCITHAAPEDEAVRAYLTSACEREPRVKLKVLPRNHGISGNSNEALSLVSGEFIALLDHDDTFAPSALFEVARVLNEDPRLDFIYSDKDQIDASGQRLNPLFKPDWSPELLLSANYLTHLTVMRTERVRAIGGWRPETDGAQDWDLFLRFLTSDSRIHHIPLVLYHWRRIETSVSMGLTAKPYAMQAQLVTLRDHLSQSRFAADIEVTGDGYFRLKWGGEQKRVSVIVVQQGSLTETIRLAEHVLALADNSDLELLIASTKPIALENPRIRVIPGNPSQSIAARLNAAARASRGDVLIFLDQAVWILDKSWIKELAGPLQDPQIGVVGAKLLDSRTGLIRSAGLVFGSDGKVESAFAGEPEGACKAFGADFWYRNLLAVGGACFSVRREVFEDIGGFAELPEYPRFDVDFCLRVHSRSGRRILANPFARMLQSGTAALEQPTDSPTPLAGTDLIRLRYPAGDPYFNRNLLCHQGRIGLNFPRLDSSSLNNPFSLEARTLVSELDFNLPMLAASKAACRGPAQHRLEAITWFVPEFSTPFYGGIHTVLRFADYFRARRQVQSRFIVLGNGAKEDTKARIALAFPELAADSSVTMLAKHSEVSALHPCDAAIATLWKTAYPVLAFNKARRKFYFLQDYEPSFYPAGSTSALAESTYHFGFIGICNTIALRDKYRELGGEGEYFNPCVDSSIFHANGRRSDPSGRYVVVFYGRPTHPRNCFELVSAGMTILKRRLGDQVRILAAGSDWDVASYGLNGVVENLGLLDYRLTGPLYRTCDVGVSMMMTAHPSYLPLELMACGALVVSNRNPQTAWFLKDRVNCLLAENSATALADAIEEALFNRALRSEISERAAELIRKEYSQWDAQAERIYQYLLDCC